MIEKLFPLLAILGLTIGTGAFAPFLLPAEAGPTPETSLFSYCWYVIYGASAVLVLRRRTQLIRLIKANKATFMLVALAMASLMWSGTQAQSMKSCLFLIGTTLFAIAILLHGSMAQAVRLAVIGLSAACVASFVVCLTLPDIGIGTGPYDGAWLGVFTHKNGLGRAMALYVLLLLYLIPRTEGVRRAALAALALAASFLVVRSDSATSIVVLLIGIGCYMSAGFFLRNRNFVLLGSLTLIGLAGVIIFGSVFQFDDVLALLSRDSSLTGRNVIWAAVWHQIGDKFYLGYGYKAFWNEAPSEYVFALLGWNAGQSHNGFLDLWLDIGLAGIGLFVWSYLGALKRVIAALLDNQSALGLVLLVFFFATNLTESSILIPASAFWVFYLLIAFYHDPSFRSAADVTDVAAAPPVAGPALAPVHSLQ